MRRAVDFTKPADVRRWISALRAEVEDIADLAHEVAKPKGKRVIEREHAKSEIARVTRNLRRLLNAGRRGLPVKTPAPH